MYKNSKCFDLNPLTRALMNAIINKMILKDQFKIFKFFNNRTYHM